MKINDRLVKAFDKFNADLNAFALETGEEIPTLYEDINTTRQVSNFRLCKNGVLHWTEVDRRFNPKTWGYDPIVVRESEQLSSEDEAREYLSFWRANLRRARRYFATAGETLDKMADGEMEDNE